MRKFTLPTVVGIFAVLLLAACGGGSTGIVDVPRESGCYNCDYRRNNPTAADLLDHWNDPQPVTAALTLSAVSAQEATARKATLASLSSADTGTRAQLRNADVNRMTVLGEGDGITYGQWKAGPAGTMNIEFRWLSAEPDRDPLTPSAALRARTERAGKAWSYRLQDDFAPTLVPASLAPREHLVDLADTVADDLLINVFYARDYAYSTALWSRTSNRGWGTCFSRPVGTGTLLGLSPMKSDTFSDMICETELWHRAQTVGSTEKTTPSRDRPRWLPTTADRSHSIDTRMAASTTVTFATAV